MGERNNRTTFSQGAGGLAVLAGPTVGGGVSSAYFVTDGILGSAGYSVSASNYVSSLANRVFAIPYSCPFSFKLTKVSIGVGTASAGNFFNAAIYDQNKNLIVDSGGISTTTGGGVIVTATINALIPSGFLYVAWAVTSITPSFGAIATGQSGGGANQAIMQNKISFSSNVLAAGAMPASLGTLTGINGIASVPTILWEC